MGDPRVTYRVATAIHSQLGRGREPPPPLPAEAWRCCQRLHQLLLTADDRHWPAAADRCRDDLQRAVADLRWHLDACTSELKGQPPHVTTIRDVYADLVALDVEFEDLHFDRGAKTVSLSSPPVELEGVYLGAFTIELNWESVGTTRPDYRVIPLGDYASSVDSSVSHPHVRDEGLCEGYAQGALRAAVADGRLLDFFTIVAQTLATYNPESAYVSLERWQGVPCSDCGEVTADDDAVMCERCERDLCDDCSSCCTACGRSLCNDCGDSCSACSETHCPGCLASCAGCDRAYCKGCLDDEHCDQCRCEAADEAEEVAAEAQAGETTAAAS